MTESSSPPPKPTWRFPAMFWFANAMELCERAAFYAFFILITLYLSTVVGFTDVEAAIISGLYSGTLYLLPPFAGLIADKIGFRRAMIIAFALLTLGYSLLTYFHDKVSVCLFLVILVCGSAFIKPLITGTVAKSTDEVNRARGFSVFYWTVNIGAFLGKTFIPILRTDIGLTYINTFSALVAGIALIIAILFYRPAEMASSEKKSFGQLFYSLWKILTNGRLIVLTLIIAGFWTVQQQLYATMPKYVIRMVGESAKPEWIANVNPLTVVIAVVFITQWMRNCKAITSMTVGMFLMPLSAFVMSLGPSMQGAFGDNIFGMMHPFTFVLVVGIAIQGLAECFISPRFLEFFSKQAPKGEEGIYLGFSHLHSFFSAIIGFFMSGFLLEKYCPDPKTLKDMTAEQIQGAYAHAHYIWYYFVGIALISGIALLMYSRVCQRLDKQKEALAAENHKEVSEDSSESESEESLESEESSESEKQA